MSGRVVVRYCNEPTVCLKRHWPFSSRTSLSENCNLSSIGVSIGYKFSSPMVSRSEAKYCCCVVKISPFPSFVNWMPKKKLKFPQSFNTNSFPNLMMTESMNLFDDVVKILSSTYTKKYTVTSLFVKINKDWSPKLSLNPIATKKSRSLWNHADGDCRKPYIAFFILQTWSWCVLRTLESRRLSHVHLVFQNPM